MNASLRYYGDPFLREKAIEVTQVTDEIRELVRQMIEIMETKNGIGLAAPQLGVLLRIIVSNAHYEDENGELHIGEAKAYINPVLTNPSDILVERSEGCLSIPKLYAPVIRPLSITVEALNLQGEKFKEEKSGYVARCLMHEYDHLDGILFVDRIKGRKRSELEPLLLKIKQHYYKK